MERLPTSPTRRKLLQGGTALAAFAGVLVADGPAQAATGTALTVRSFPDAMRMLGGLPTPSPLVLLTVPEVADNGAVVPISVSSSVPGPQEIWVVVDTNPVPIAACFTIPEGTEAFVSTRIRMAQSGRVYAAVKSGDRLLGASRETRVTVGGCG